METVVHKVQFCVVGGGLAGMCAAIQAARLGVKTLLMHERPVLGGNASSEIRMWICGAKDRLETGIIEELRLENLYRNNYPNFSVWDSILYEKVMFQEHLECLLNCTCQDAVMDGARIRSVKGWQMTTQTYHVVEADFFADCSGDSILAPLSGAEFRFGRENKSEYGESLAQEAGDSKTMGMSCLIQARETGSPQKYVPPSWAYKYSEGGALSFRDHTLEGNQNFWWLELGGSGNSIKDTEEVRHELLKTAFGIWDHIKNGGDHGAENWVLDWVGFLPGKRESRRYIGDHVLTQGEVLDGGKFPDVIAYGGWPMDDHHPGGFLHDGEPNTNIYPEQPYGIPLRCLYSVNVENLMFAGRNISASHVALSSTRVMATCATLGQAAGTLAFFAAGNYEASLRETAAYYTGHIQYLLMENDCHLPGKARPIPAEVSEATLTASSGNPEPLRNGVDRDFPGEENAWICHQGSRVTYDFNKPRRIRNARLVLDSDLNRPHLNMPNKYPLNMPLYETPATLVKSFHLEADGREIYRETGNYQRFISIPLDVTAREITLVIDDDCGAAGKKVFAFQAR